MSDELLRITFDFEMMKKQFRAMLLRNSIEIETLLEEAFKEYCEENRLEEIIKYEVIKALDKEVKEASERYFRRGRGKEYIGELTEEMFDEILTKFRNKE